MLESMMNDEENWLSLPKKDFIVLHLRYEGKTHQEIAECLAEYGHKTSAGSISNNLAKGGRLNVLYQKYAQSISKALQIEAQKILTRNIAQAALVLADGLKSPNERIRQAAAMNFLDRAFGKPVATAMQPIVPFQQELERWKVELGITEEDLMKEAMSEKVLDNVPPRM